jgi:serum/glucocorticoid-regulated kinase 2
MEKEIYDTLKWSKDREILKIIGKESLYYSNKIIKINHFNIGQERSLILTDESIYIIQKKGLKRKVAYSQVIGITFTKLSQEFVVHGDDAEYDLYFQSPEKNIIICLIAKLYEEKINSTLKLCEVPEKYLRNYVTGKKEKKKDNFSRIDISYLINTNSFIKENIRKDKNLRLLSKENLSDSDEDNPEKDKAQILFCKLDGIVEIKVEDFQIVRILGRGAFGKVYLVLYKPTNEYYAMKCLKKEFLIDENELINNTKINKIQNLDYPFLIEVYLCFLTEERIYFIMNVVQGDDMFNLMRFNEERFDESQVKFYAAIIGMAINYLHSKGIILRDLRLDNIIIDQDGYLKITNFKMNQLFKLNNQYMLLKETSEFLAPEVISFNQCEKHSDWWSYGIILYQLLFGIPPFFSNDDNILRQQIVKNELKFPKNSNISENAKNLLKLLLKKNPNERMGGINGFEEIKKHKFFEGINFNDIINRKIEPYFKPPVVHILKNKESTVEFTYEDLNNSKILIN